MNKSQRIYFNTEDGSDTDKFVKVKLEQDTDSLEFMSMSISTKDVYQDFNADYGVLVGRVLANGGIGVENAKISIFIPISDDDAEDSAIYSLYPYTTPRDKNLEGKRYNLLPRVSQINPDTRQIEPKQAFGSFPIKEEVVTNPPMLEVYEKYYKYTALTNEAGDYMIYGVPIGTQTVHLSVDITDVGKYSVNPASMVTNLGYSANFFTDRGTKIKPSDDLGDLPHIETQEITVDVIPFWGDAEIFEIGITRQDFRIRSVLANTFTIFGTAFTDSADTMRSSEDDNDPRVREIRDFYVIFPNSETESAPNNNYGLALANKRIAIIKETIYYYPSNMTDAEINSADPETDMLVLTPDEYSVYTRNGDFAFLINCNRRRVITNEDGTEVEVPYDNPNGVFTEFRGFVVLEYSEEEAPMTSRTHTDKDNESGSQVTGLRAKYKFPQHAPANQSFNYNQSSSYNDTWRKQHMKFEAQKFYSFAKFHGCVANNVDKDDDQWGNWNSFFNKERYEYVEYSGADRLDLNNAGRDGKFNIGPIQVKDYSGYNNTQYGMVPNHNVNGEAPRFGSNWLNLCVYFPQTGYAINPIKKVNDVRTSSFLATQFKDNASANAYFVMENTMPIAGGQINTKWFGRSDLHWTDIIEVPLADIILMKGFGNKGFTDQQVGGLTLDNYRNGNSKPGYTPWKGTWSDNCPLRGGKDNGVSANTSNDPLYYFYKGFDTADCIEFLYDLGLVTE